MAPPADACRRDLPWPLELGSDRRLLRRPEPCAADRRERALFRRARRRGRLAGARPRRAHEVRMKPEDLVRPEILALSAYAVAPGAGMVKLDAMENPYRLPAPLRQELAGRLAEVELNRYPEANPPRLRELIIRKMRVPAGMDLLLGNGSDDLIQIIALALARPGAVMMY